MKCPSGNPGMPVEVRNMKMVWLHIQLRVDAPLGPVMKSQRKKKEAMTKKKMNVLAFIRRPTEKSKNSSKAAKKKSLFFLVSTSINSVEGKRVIAQAKKLLEGKAISYSCQYKKPAEIENIMFFII
eukprot:502406-Ditylum_brightwellii.AAC.1